VGAFTGFLNFSWFFSSQRGGAQRAEGFLKFYPKILKTRAKRNPAL